MNTAIVRTVNVHTLILTVPALAIVNPTPPVYSVSLDTMPAKMHQSSVKNAHLEHILSMYALILWID